MGHAIKSKEHVVTYILNKYSSIRGLLTCTDPTRGSPLVKLVNLVNYSCYIFLCYIAAAYCIMSIPVLVEFYVVLQ